jgi:hypothetical protein
MQSFRACGLPVLLFGTETWALTQKQAVGLDVLHSDSHLQNILDGGRVGRHSRHVVQQPAADNCCGLWAPALIDLKMASVQGH